MNLYVKNNSNLDIYNLIPKLDKVKKYKQNEMEKIPGVERVLKATCNEDFIMECPLHCGDTVLASCLNYTEYSFLDLNVHLFKKYYHRLENYNISPYHLDPLNYYYSGAYDKTRLVKVLEDRNKGNCNLDDLKAVQYLLLTQKDYKKDEKGKKTIYTMDNIINIPETLYYLESLLQENYLEVMEKNIDEQLNLFELSEDPIYSIGLDDLNFLENNGVIRKLIDEEKLETSSEIIRKVKSIKK